MFIKLLLVYAASYIGCRLIVRFLKEQKLLKDRDDPKVACITIAPLMFIGLIVSALMSYIYTWASKKKREDESVNRYNKKLPEIWYKLNRFIETGKPSILDNASTFNKEYDKYIDEQDLFNDFRPAYDTAKVVKTEATDNGPKDILTGYHEAMDFVSQVARQTQQPIITAAQRPAGSRCRLTPGRTDNIRKINDHINELFISITKEKCRGY